MVLAIHLNVTYLAAQDAQGGEELLALVGGHVGIYRTVEEEQRGVDLVGIEEGRLVHIAVLVIPGITAVGCPLTTTDADEEKKR